jgi:hypothetical protein
VNNGRLACQQIKQTTTMKRNILITIGAVALAAITINATAAEPLLSPRAAGNQIKHVSGIANDPNLVAANNNVSPSGALLSPRAASNQIKTVPGVANDVNPALVCAKTMTGSPKAIQACIESGTMSACKPVSVAPLK